MTRPTRGTDDTAGGMEGVRFGESTAVHVACAAPGSSRRPTGASPRTPRRRRARRVRRLLAWTALLALIGGAGWLVLFSSHLAVHRVDIDITGERVSDRDVRRAARVPMRTPLARMDTETIRRRVEFLVKVETARVERSWPQTLRIEVRERTPVAVTGSGALIDRFGVTVETRGEGRSALPRLAVPEPGDPLELTEDPAARAGLAVLGELPEKIKRDLVEIKVPSPEEVTLLLNREDGGKVRVVWGSAARSEEKARIVSRLMNQRASVYDVSSPEVVTLR